MYITFLINITNFYNHVKLNFARFSLQNKYLNFSPKVSYE